MFVARDSDGHLREVLPNGKLGLVTDGLRTDLMTLTFFVDQEVNIVKKLTLEQALDKWVEPKDRDLVLREYERWHAK